MENNTAREGEFLEIYESLLTLREKYKSFPDLAEYYKSIVEEVNKFEEEYPEIVSEYHFKK